MRDLETYTVGRRAATYAELEQEAGRVTANQIRSLPSLHPDQQHRTHLGVLSEEGARLYVLYLERARQRSLCDQKSPQGALEFERLWQEMTRIMILLNGFFARDIPRSRLYPPDVIFVDCNLEVYVLSGPWVLMRDPVRVEVSVVDLVIERHEEMDGLNL